MITVGLNIAAYRFTTNGYIPRLNFLFQAPSSLVDASAWWHFSIKPLGGDAVSLYGFRGLVGVPWFSSVDLYMTKRL